MSSPISAGGAWPLSRRSAVHPRGGSADRAPPYGCTLRPVRAADRTTPGQRERPLCPNGHPRGHRGHNHRLSWVPERLLDPPRPPAVAGRQPRDREPQLSEGVWGSTAGVPVVAVPRVAPGAPAALVAGWHLM